MKLISWNVNGKPFLYIQKGFLDYFHAADADFFLHPEIQVPGIT